MTEARAALIVRLDRNAICNCRLAPEERDGGLPIDKHNEHCRYRTCMEAADALRAEDAEALARMDLAFQTAHAALLSADKRAASAEAKLAQVEQERDALRKACEGLSNSRQAILARANRTNWEECAKLLEAAEAKLAQMEQENEALRHEAELMTEWKGSNIELRKHLEAAEARVKELEAECASLLDILPEGI